MTTTFERLKTLLVRDYQVDPSALVPDAPLESLGLDSLAIAELLFTVEDEFGIKVGTEPTDLATVGDVVAFVDGLIAAQHAADTPADP